ncbi:MAG: hypothetical protein M5U01_37175 [Ardenticatenaceae bacterium]|nr:hypothetical protein [Ardenticatenaceae bacterium]HBY93349.1 hypothetical protein [Chloroflexota bacterium]
MNDLDFVRQRLAIVDELLREAGQEDEGRLPWQAPPDPLTAVDEPRHSPLRLLALERQFLLHLLDECHAGQAGATLRQWLARNERLVQGRGGAREADARASAAGDLASLTHTILTDLLARLERWLAQDEGDTLSS